MVEDWCLNYLGGLAKLEEIKGNPEIRQSFYHWLDELGCDRIVANPIFDKALGKFFWKTITPAGGMSLKELEDALLEKGVLVYPDAKAKIFSRGFKQVLSVYSTLEPVDIGCASFSELRFKCDATSQQVFGRLRDLGYKPLPIIAAPWILLEAGSEGSFLRCTHTELMIVDGDSANMFSVARDANGLGLSVCLAGGCNSGSRILLFRLR